MTAHTYGFGNICTRCGIYRVQAELAARYGLEWADCRTEAPAPRSPADGDDPTAGGQDAATVAQSAREERVGGRAD